MDLAQGKNGRSLGTRTSTAAAIIGHGHGFWRRTRDEKKRPRDTPGRGLYAPTTGSPDALNVAPDASGDHQTHAQRGMQNGIAPDDGHRTLALASGAPGYAR